MNRHTLVMACSAFLLFSSTLQAAEEEKPKSLQVRDKDLLYNAKPMRLRGVALGDPWMGRKDRPASDFEFLAKD